MKASFLVILNEIYKGLLVAWHYKFNIINEFITLGINFLGTAFLMNYGRTDLQEFGPALLGYIIWVYAYCILNVSYTLTLEGRSGTLEQMYMSPVHPAVIFIGSTTATLVTSTIMILIMIVILAVVCGISIPFHVVGVPVVIITLLGLIGFGLGIAGTALLHKHVAGFVDLTSTILFYVNGAMLPIDRYPAVIKSIAQTLPTTQGIIVLRKVVLEGESLLSTIYDGSLLVLILNSGIYFCCGLMLFLYCEKIAKKRGRLGQY